MLADRVFSARITGEFTKNILWNRHSFESVILYSLSRVRLVGIDDDVGVREGMQIVAVFFRKPKLKFSVMPGSCAAQLASGKSARNWAMARGSPNPFHSSARVAGGFTKNIL